MLRTSIKFIVQNGTTKRNYSNYTKMTIFDTNVKTVQKNNTVTNVDDPKHYDYLISEVADRLADRILDIKDIKCGRVLDFGSRNGPLYKFIQEKGANIEKYYMIDSSKHLLYRDEHLDEQYSNAGRNNNVKPTRIHVNSLEDKIEGIEDQSLDLIISNLSLHWINDLPGVFGGLKRLLKPNGVLLASLFGEDTLMELKDSLYLAEIEREGGFSPHVSPFTKISDIGNILSKNRYTLPTVDTEKIVANYDNMFVLMKDLQNMGENNAILKRRNYTSKDTFLASSAIYSNLYGNEDGTIPATFQIIYLIGWAPHESQQKPLARGSAKKHFSEIDNSFGFSLKDESPLNSMNNSVIENSKINEQNKEQSEKQQLDNSLNEPFPKTEDFVIKRLDYHGNFHFDQEQQQKFDQLEKEKKEKEKKEKDNNNNNNNNNNNK